MAPGSFLQQSIAVQSYHVMKKKFACVGVFDKLCMHRRLHLCTHSSTDFEEKPQSKEFLSPPKPTANAKIHYHCGVIISGGGASQEASRYVSIHGGTRSLQKQKVEVGEALCTWRVLLTGYCGGHTVSRMAVYKRTACKHLLSKHLRQAHF